MHSARASPARQPPCKARNTGPIPEQDQAAERLASLCGFVRALAAAFKTAKAPRVGQRTIWFVCEKTMVLGGRRRRLRRSLNFAGGRRRSHLPKACRHKFTGAAGHPGTHQYSRHGVEGLRDRRRSQRPSGRSHRSGRPDVSSGELLSGPGQAREAGATRSRAAHPSGSACGSAIDRANLSSAA
jgi:hypothetical protein